jgi:hypothetical protein
MEHRALGVVVGSRPAVGSRATVKPIRPLQLGARRAAAPMSTNMLWPGDWLLVRIQRGSDDGMGKEIPCGTGHLMANIANIRAARSDSD